MASTTIDDNELTGFIVTPTAAEKPTGYTFDTDTASYKTAVNRQVSTKKGNFGIFTVNAVTSEYVYTKNRKFQDEVGVAAEKTETFTVVKRDADAVIDTITVTYDFTPK